MRNSNCSLCERDMPLRNSHIIPEWAYTDAYDEKHRLNVVSTQLERPRPYEQKGVRERLLCENCEQQLSVYERYARGVIKGGSLIAIGSAGDGRVVIDDLDYDQFKLFQLSILWRAGVAKDPMFSQINLGPHEKRLRMMLRNEDPGRPVDYPCMIFAIMAGEEPFTDFLDSPARTRLDGGNCYRFMFAGSAWVFVVARHSPPDLVLQHALTKEGKIVVPVVRAEGLDYIVGFATAAYEMGRLRDPRRQ